MRGAGLFPELCLPRPIGLTAVAHRHPDLDAELARVAPGLLGQTAQLPEHVERALVRRIGVRHPAVAELGDALQGALVMPAEPDRHLAGSRARVDAGIVDRVPFALEGNMRLRPQLLHDLDLLFGAPAAVVEVFVKADELDFVPAHPDAEPETAAA